MKKENEKDFQAGDICNKWHICNKLHGAEDFRVRNHCHMTWNYWDSAHKSCILILDQQIKKLLYFIDLKSMTVIL